MKTATFNFKSLMFVLLAGLAFTFNSCKQEIKIKHLEGTWTVKSFTSSTSETTRSESTYDDSDCEPDTDCPVYELVETTSETYNGTTVSATWEENYEDSDCGDDDEGAYTGSVTGYTIEIKDDGTYKVSLSYSVTCHDGDTDEDFTYTGTYSSDLLTWFVEDASKQNSVITFDNFPHVDFSNIDEDNDLCGNFGNGDVLIDEGPVTFRLEKEDKSNITLKSEESTTNSDSDVHEYTGFDPDFDEIECKRTTVTTITSTWTLTVQLSQD